MVSAGRAPAPAVRAGQRPLARGLLVGVLVLAIATLLAALGGGLVRLGVLPPAQRGPTAGAAVAWHGALMCAGFFGALISLERVVALQRGLAVPAMAGLGGLLLGWAAAWPAVAAPAVAAAGLLWALSAAGLVGLYAWAGWRRAWSLPLAVQMMGALALLAGNLLWAAGRPEEARLGWAGFLLLTIAGERRELTRLVPLPRWGRQLFLLLAASPLMVLGLAVGGVAVAGPAWWLACAGLALWLARFDPGLRLLGAVGWAGHTAVCLVSALVWLAVAAMLGLAAALGQAQLGPVAWHVFWVGFVFSMVFGHAPLMLPVLAGLRPRPTRLGRVALALLGASVAVRIAGAIGAAPGLTALAGAGHVLALAGFAAVMAFAVRQGRAG